MRRPLKPFVTEYKPSTRRTSPLQPEQAILEADRPAPKPADVALREPEDSYEAALRAADALFSSRPASALHQSEPANPTASPSEALLPLEKNGGRILRVIDEEPSPQLAALEAERAPKRRGRKPGSKNKPKVAALVSEAAKPPRPRPQAATLSPLPAVLLEEPLAQLQALTTTSRGPRRTGWGRDRLRPGEDWKRRRLPRVCW